MQQLIQELNVKDILFQIEDEEVKSFDLIKFIKYLGQIPGITFWVTLGRGIQEVESPKPFRIHVLDGKAGYATYMLTDENGKVLPGGHGHLQISSVDKISLEVLPSCTCLPATYNIFFEDIALRSALLNVSFPVWWNPAKPERYDYYEDAYRQFMQLVEHFGTALLKVDGKWIRNKANIHAIENMHSIAKKRFEKIYTKINYANDLRAEKSKEKLTQLENSEIKQLEEKYGNYIIEN